MTSQPNIVCILTDDQRFDTIAALGHPQIRTPNLDWLVANGTTFTHAHIPGGTCGAVCMPSRAMIHTGRTLFHVTDSGRTIPPEHATLGETLGRNGYRTFGTGKWHNGPDSFNRSFQAGAEIFFGGMQDHWNVPAFNYDPTGAYAGRCRYIVDPYRGNVMKEHYGDHIHAGHHSTDVLGKTTVRFIQDYAHPEPFFCYTAFLAPHDPRTMPDEFRKIYDPSSIELPPNFMPGHPFDNGELAIRDEMLAPFPRTPDDTRRQLAEYYAMISHLDARIGEIIHAVRRKGLLERTLFVLAGDNGLAIGQHGLFGKQSLYEHSTRVPLIFTGPGVPKGRRTDALVYLLDIFPTLCDLTGTPIPASVEGTSLLSAMAGDVGRDALYLAYTEKQRGVRTRSHKLIEYVVNGAHVMTQLFDLQADPWERRNLADDPALRATRNDLTTTMLSLRDPSGDRASKWGEIFWSAWQKAK